MACCGRSGKEDEGVAPSTARSVLLLRGGRFLCFLRRPNGRLQLSSMSPARLNWGQGLAGCGIVADSAKSESGVSRFGLVQELRMLHRIYVSRIADTPGKKKQFMQLPELCCAKMLRISYAKLWTLNLPNPNHEPWTTLNPTLTYQNPLFL